MKPYLLVTALCLSASFDSACANQTNRSPDVAKPLTSKQSEAAIFELRQRKLTLPIAGFDIAKAKSSYTELRNGQAHEALDMPAPRNTPVLAADDGVVAKLFDSRLGGTTVYQFDPSHRFVYYYAHLERYADGLKNGQKISRGQLLGYVGTSGNAPKNAPHLHFSITLPDASQRWWVTAPINPYLVFKK